MVKAKRDERDSILLREIIKSVQEVMVQHHMAMRLTASEGKIMAFENHTGSLLALQHVEKMLIEQQVGTQKTQELNLQNYGEIIFSVGWPKSHKQGSQADD